VAVFTRPAVATEISWLSKQGLEQTAHTFDHLILLANSSRKLLIVSLSEFPAILHKSENAQTRVAAEYRVS
jgi:hypothetical protein